MAPDSRMRCLALLMRCAIVASGTRKARAISTVVRPPTALSVNAIRASDVRDGWQQSSSSVRLSSASGAPTTSSADGETRPSAGVRDASASSRRVRAPSLRSPSMRRRDATRISHARGSSGTPSRGHCTTAARSAS